MKGILQVSLRKLSLEPHSIPTLKVKLSGLLPLLSVVLVMSHTALGAGYWAARESSRKWWSIAASADGTRLVAVTSWHLNGGGEIYTSADGGDTWAKRFTIPTTTPLSASMYVASSSTGAKLVACGGGTQIYTSTDYGANWSPHEVARTWNCVASSADGTKLIAGVWGGYLYASVNSGTAWSSCGSSSDWNDVASSSDGTKLLAVENNGYTYTSTNSGSSWTPRYPHPYRRNYFCAASSGDGISLVVGEYPQESGDLYVSSNSGETWMARTFPGAWRSVAVSSLNGSRRLAATYGGPIYDISGINTAISPTWEHWTDIAISADGTRVFGVVYDGQIWAYFDDGTPGVTVAATDATAGEPASGQGNGTFTFTRIGSTAAALTVNYTVGGTASGGSDYAALGTTVTFEVGSATVTKTVSVNDDTQTEGDETAVLTLAAGSGYRVAVPSSATVTIRDDERTKHWTGTYSGYWGVSGNWLENTIPVNGDELVFPTATRYVVTNNISNLQIDRVTFTKGGYLVKGNAVTISNGIKSAPPGAEINEMQIDIVLGASQKFQCDANTFYLGGDINLGANTLTVTNASGTKVYIGGPAGWGIISGTGGVTKEGFGTLEFGGWSVANTYSGPTYVKEGILLLDRTTVPSIPGQGALTVGDATGAAGTAVVRYNGNDNQIGAAPVIVNASGLVELSGRSDDFSDITLNGGDITLGAGTLTLSTGTVRVLNSSSVINGASGSVSFSGTTTFDVASSVLFDLQAPTAGSGGLSKAGPGTMRLGWPGTYAGPTTVHEGRLEAWTAQSLGGTASGTRVNSGATLQVYADRTYTGEPLFLNGAGFPGYGALDVDAVGTNSWTGPVTLESDAKVLVYNTAAHFMFPGVVSGSGGLTKAGTGTLTLEGAAGNTYAGATRVDGGRLVLAKTGGNAIPGDLYIGDGSGGVEADVVEWAAGTHEQIANTAWITLASSALWKQNKDNNDTIRGFSGSGVIDFGTLISYYSDVYFGSDGTDVVFNGTIRGDGGRLWKGGSGTLAFSGNVLCHETHVSGGMVRFNGYQPDHLVYVSGSTAALGGSGTVGSVDVSGNGRISPGASPGRLTCGNLTFSGAGSLAIELNGTTPSLSHDQLSITGTVNLMPGPASLPSMQLTVGFLPTEGDQFAILRNDLTDAITGAFAGLSEGAVVSDSSGRFSFRISYAGGSPANDVVLTMVNQSLAAGAALVFSGNGNGIIESNECNVLSLPLNNTSAGTVSGLSATLQSLTPGVVVVQPYSTYPSIPAGATRTNDAFFQITTQPGFVCSSPVNLELQVATTTHGTLKVPFSLPSACASGSGICELCPDLTLTGSLGASSPQQAGLLIQTSYPSTCAAPTTCPGLEDGANRAYNAHIFRNGPSATCISISLTGRTLQDELFSAAYLGSFDPANLCANYLADCAASTMYAFSPRVYSFNVAANQVFVVTVSGSGDYLLSVTGANCRPTLSLTRIDPSNVRLEWTTAAAGYRLEGTNRLNGVPWAPIPPHPPMVVNSKFVATNVVDGIKFFRLLRP